LELKLESNLLFLSGRCIFDNIDGNSWQCLPNLAINETGNYTCEKPYLNVGKSSR